MAESNINDRFADFPEPIREAIEKSEWQAKLRQIAAKYHLRIDQGSILENETLAILDGSQSIEEYTVHLAGLLKLAEPDLRAMAADLERDIFAPIQKAIQSLAPDDEEEARVGAAGVGEDEADDLEALLNEGDAALVKAASLKPRPVAAPVAPAAPVARNILGAVGGAAMPATNTPAPAPKPAAPVAPAIPSAPATAAVSVPLASAAQKLATPVVKPAETVVGNLQKPAAPVAPAASAPGAPASHDPYREPIA
jgi:hypothetical protein